MSIWAIAAMAIAGGAGASARLVLDGVIKTRFRVPYPLGTTLINISGSFLLGLLTGLTLTHAVPIEWRVILGVGFLGGYTTFSTASFETVRLAQDGRYVAAVLNAFGMLAGALVMAGLGLWLGVATR